MGKNNKRNQVQKEQQTPNNQQDARPKDNSVTVAIIGAIATITAAILGIFALWVRPPSTMTATVTPSLTSIPFTATSTKEPELVFGPEQGYLEEDKGFVFRPNYPDLKIHNSIISVTFVNPDNTDAWSYHIYFRDKVGIESNRFSMCSCGTWSLYSSPSTKGLTELYSGTISNLNTSSKGQNHIVLTIKDLSISIIVNEKSISNEKMELDVDLGSGGVALVSNIKIGYGGLRIISLDNQ